MSEVSRSVVVNAHMVQRVWINSPDCHLMLDLFDVVSVRADQKPGDTSRYTVVFRLRSGATEQLIMDQQGLDAIREALSTPVTL